MIAYKVVRIKKVNKSLIRTSAYTINYKLRYRKNQITTAKFGGVLVFSTEDEATSYANLSVQPIEVWKVECIEPIDLPNYRGDIFDDEGQLNDIWTITNSRYGIAPWPKGTLAFKRVKLIERVK